MDSRAKDFEALLAQAGWLRALARSLVADANVAEDLVQSTWVAALEHPPRDDTPLRRWCALVLRNFVRQERRGTARRVAREAEVARPEALDAPSSMAGEAHASLQLSRALFDAVAALDEPYRTAIVQRYYEGLAPRDIARRAGVPVKTVKTRLNRGLTKLRARLDRDFDGDRRAWLLAFLPLVDRGAFAPLGVLWMDAKIKVAIAIAVLAGGVATYVGLLDRGAELSSAPPRVVALDHALETMEELAAPVAPAPLPPTREMAVAAEAPSVAKSAPEVAAMPSTLEGRVIDLTRRPIADVAVVAVPRGSSPDLSKTLVRTRSDGSFTLERRRADGLLEVASDEYVTVLAAQGWTIAEVARPVIVVARRQPLGGVVLDAQSAPIVGAQVSIALDDAFRNELGEILDDAFQKNWEVRTDAQGRFELPHAPAARGSLAASSALHAERRIAIPEYAQTDLVIVLEPSEAPHVVVSGIVIDARDAPVPGAHVAIGMSIVETNGDGRFAIDLETSMGRRATRNSDGAWVVQNDMSEVVALKPGFQPARAALPTMVEMRALAPTPIALRLGAAPLSISGRVHDADERPLAHVVIETLDETTFGRVKRSSGNASAFIDVSIECMLRGGLGSSPVKTETDGRFEIGGLLDRSYRLHVVDIDTLRSFVSAPVAAGSKSVELSFRAGDVCSRIAGRVVGRDGKPVADVRIAPSRIVADQGYPSTFGQSIVTDSEGRFAFQKLALEGLGFQIGGELVWVDFWRPIPADQDPEELELVVSRRCHVQADLGERVDFADAFHALDEQGEPAPFMQFQGVSIWSPDEIQITNGKSDAIAVEETARTIVFTKGDVEVARVPVQFTPGAVNVVRP